MEDRAENLINMASAEDMPGQSSKQVNTLFSEQDTCLYNEKETELLQNQY